MYPKTEVTCWIQKIALKKLLEEANDKYPLETGGIFMGYQANMGNDVIVTDVIGPGPYATHKYCGYIPDSAFHEKEISRIYSESNQVNTYLGDWHTHPNGSGILSNKDKKVLQRISRCRESRNLNPIMAILVVCEDVEFLLWRYYEKKSWYFLLPTLVEMNIELYE